MPDDLQMFTVYVRPDDHPDKVVIRAFTVAGSNEAEPGPAWLCEDLEQAYDWLIDHGLTRLERNADDHPNIDSTWL